MVELKKFKRKKIFIFALLLAFIFPLLGTVLIIKGNSSDFSSINNFIREESGFLLLMPILVLLAINSFFLELDNNTMKNLLVIPISKKNIIISKLIVLLIFSIIFQIVGFGIGALMSLVFKIPLDGLGLNFILAIATGIVLWAAALPCITLVIWFDKSYLLSVIIVFIYTLTNYIMHFSEGIIMQPIGFNLGTLMPIPLIFRWLYQFNIPVGDVQIEFFNRFSEYFVSSPLCFSILLIESIICILLMIKIYKRREI